MQVGVATTKAGVGVEGIVVSTPIPACPDSSVAAEPCGPDGDVEQLPHSKATVARTHATNENLDIVELP